LIPRNEVRIQVGYDDGAGVAKFPFGANGLGKDNLNFGAEDFRVIMTATYTFRPIVGLFDPFMPNGLDLQMVSARTIRQNQPDYANYSTTCDYSPASGLSATNTPGAGTPTNPPPPTPVNTPV